MALPKWKAGTLYLPGDLVQPSQTAPPTNQAIPNAGFEDGDSDWNKTNATIVNEAGSFAGDWHAKQVYNAGNPGGVSMAVPLTVVAGQTVTASCMMNPSGASDQVGGQVRLSWLDGSSNVLSQSVGNQVAVSNGSGYRKSTVTAVAPAGAVKFTVQGEGFILQSGGIIRYDNFAVTVTGGSGVPAGMIFKAVQTDPGTSGASEPTWPTTAGSQVTDNEVTWEAIAATVVTWEASPILVSGSSEPEWPTSIGGTVVDGSIVWEAVSQQVTDENCPNTTVVAIVASAVYAEDGDIVRRSAAANPLDWSSENDAGYLPTGLQQANANDMAVLGQYRGNLVAWNASSFQMWQADPDPALCVILDQMDGVGSSWPKAAQAVADDLFYLSQRGVRSVGIANAAENLAAGDVGSPIDPLVQEAMSVALANSNEAIATWYPGAGQYWLAFPNFPPPALAVSGAMPDAYVGDSVSYQYTVTGGVLPYSVSATGLPDGLSMDATGKVTGTATKAGTFAITIAATDDCGNESSHADEVVIGAMTISGDLADGYAGGVSSGSYTNTHGIAPITYAVTAGTFPPGVTLATDGTWSGTFTAAGSFTWTVTATDAAGNVATVEDSADAVEKLWWLTAGNGTSLYTSLWTSPDLETWSGPYTRSPYVDPTVGPVSGHRTMLIANRSSSIELITDFDLDDGVSGTIVDMGLATLRFIRKFPGFLFASDQAGDYALSLNGGASWDKYTTPAGGVLDVLDMAWLASVGRWVIVTYGAPRRSYWTESDIPNTGWTQGGSVNTGECLIASPTAVVLWSGIVGNRTTNGSTWSEITRSFTPGGDYGAYGDGTFVCTGSAGKIARSVDDGVTWAEVALPSSASGTPITSIQYGNGLFLVTVSESVSGDRLFVSADAGQTWDEVTLPYDRSSVNVDCRVALSEIIP